MWLDVSGVRSGWVRDNGRTIGSATSGASERANSDCQALFVWLWQNFSDSICPVIGGRGANPAADWSGNKQITLADKRGMIAGGLDDMGNSAAGAWANVPVVSGSVITPGSVLGEASHQLSIPELPIVTPAGTLALSASAHVNIAAAGQATSGSSGNTNQASSTAVIFDSLTGTFTGTPFGGNGKHNNVQKTVLGTFYRKL
jgi:hypothetical protein